MWEIIAKILPPPLILGLIIYAAICFLWFQPLTEERMAPAYVAQCEANTLPAVAVPVPSSHGGPQSSSASGPALTLSPESLLIIAQLQGLLHQKKDDSRDLPYQAGTSLCTCSVSKAFDGVMWPSLLHIMSLRSYVPRSIAHFDQHVAQVVASGACGHRP